MRRFWQQAGLIPAEQGQILTLDGKPLRLPEGGLLVIAPPALAAAIRDEWQRAGEGKGSAFNHAADLPLTQLHTTATQRVALDRPGVIQAIAAYGASDLLCYRAAGPGGLRERQDRAWQPWLDWAALKLDAPLVVTEGVVPIAQPPTAIAALTAAVGSRSNQELAALGVVVPAIGSLVLGLALVEGMLDAARAHAIATVDEAFQAEFWGADAEAATRISAVAGEIATAARFLELAKS